MTPTAQQKLSPADVHAESRIHVREILANHGPLPTTTIARMIGERVNKTGTLLWWMERAYMVRKLDKIPTVNRGENVWALRCYRG